MGKEPTPGFAAELESTSEAMLAMLADVGLREVALLKFEGFSNTDVADRIKRTRRTVERRLETIRRIWIENGVIDEEVLESPEVEPPTTSHLA